VVGRALLGAALLLLALAFAPGAEARVYWGNYNSGTFGRANLDGSGVDQSFILAAPGAIPYGVAVDSAHVYWINFAASNAIGRANLDGSGVDQSFVPTGATGGDGVAVDAGHIYWANVNAGTIGRANLDGTGVNQSFITGASGPSGPAVDGAHIYWANGSNGTIGRADLSGAGANESFITGASQPLQVAVDGAHIYWANYDNGNGTTIGRAELNGTDVNQSFISGASGVSGVGADGAHIYWANNGADNGTTIGRANLDGTDVNQSFISGGNGPWYLAVAPLDTTITAAPGGTVASSAASFSFSGSEPGGFQCQLDSGGFSSCTSPMSYSGLAVGAHVFEVRAANGSGDVDPSPATAAWNVSAPVVASPGMPSLSSLKVTPTTFTLPGRLVKGRCEAITRSNRRHRRCARKVALKVSYKLNIAASVSFTVERTAPGRLVNGRCEAPARKNRRHRRCTRVTAHAKITRTGKAGANSFILPVRIGRLRLGPASYRLSATPTVRGRTGSPHHVTFRIVR
jgi:hypothetical protein